MSATSDDLLEELVEPRELAGRADELAEVLDPAGRLDGVLGLQLGEVAGALERRLQQVARTDVRHVVGVGVGERRHRAELVEQGRRTTRCRGRPGR